MESREKKLIINYLFFIGSLFKKEGLAMFAVLFLIVLIFYIYKNDNVREKNRCSWYYYEN